jgi:hypothetical protein
VCSPVGGGGREEGRKEEGERGMMGEEGLKPLTSMLPSPNKSAVGG